MKVTGMRTKAKMRTKMTSFDWWLRFVSNRVGLIEKIVIKKK